MSFGGDKCNLSFSNNVKISGPLADGQETVMRASSLDEGPEIFHLGSVSWNGKVSDDKPGDGVPDVRLQVKAGAVEGIIKRHAEDCVRHH